MIDSQYSNYLLAVPSILPLQIIRIFAAEAERGRYVIINVLLHFILFKR